MSNEEWGRLAYEEMLRVPGYGAVGDPGLHAWENQGEAVHRDWAAVAGAIVGRAVAAERERCCDVVARFFMDPLPDRHMSLRDVVIMLGRITEMIQTGGKS